MESIFDNLTNAPVLFLILFVLAIVAAGLGAFFTRRKKNTPNLLVLNSENGRIEISREAIQKVVQHTCEEFREVSRSRIHLRQSRGHIHVKVQLLLTVETRVGDITKHLQKRVTRAIRDDLGIKNLADVTVMVAGFSPPAVVGK